jgi:hypothetical protein
MLKAPPTERIVFSERAASKYVEDSEGFIRLRSRHRASTPPYKTLDPGRNASESETDASGSSASDSDEDEGNARPLSAYQERLVELERVAKENASSPTAWLALLSHMLTQYPVTARNAVKARAEVTLSVLSRALPSLPPGPQATDLRLRYLQAGEEIWSPERLDGEWQKVLQFPDADVQMAWLEWRIRVGSGRIDAVLTDATSALATLTNETDRLRVFWRVAALLRQAGVLLYTLIYLKY